jgi:palmitoyl-protein thioesterase
VFLPLSAAVGLSQGNFLVEAYIALVNDPPVFNFVSICGPLQGEATCPKNIAFDMICPVWKVDPYGALAFSSYWKVRLDLKTATSDLYCHNALKNSASLTSPLHRLRRPQGTMNKAEYLKKSKMLADVLNEKDAKNATVTANWKSLNSIMLIEATKDTMIEPRESEQFGMWDWGTQGKKAAIVAMRDSEGYKGDWTGLQTLDKAGKVANSSFVGEHIRFTDAYWDATVLPYLNNYLPSSK